MGRQFSFFLGPDDAKKLSEVLAANNGLVFLDSRHHSPSPKILDMLSTDQMRTYILRREDLSSLKYVHVPMQSYYRPDEYTGNLIECDICVKPFEGTLSAGRLYYHSRYWNEFDQLTVKPEAFLVWAERLFRDAKKSLKRIDKWFLAGEQALRWRQEGIRFHQLDPRPNPPPISHVGS